MVSKKIIYVFPHYICITLTVHLRCILLKTYVPIHKCSKARCKNNQRSCLYLASEMVALASAANGFLTRWPDVNDTSSLVLLINAPKSTLLGRWCKAFRDLAAIKSLFLLRATHIRFLYSKLDFDILCRKITLLLLVSSVKPFDNLISSPPEGVGGSKSICLTWLCSDNSSKRSCRT